MSLKQILNQHISLSTKLLAKAPILRYFKRYLKYGYYPFYIEGISEYKEKVMAAVEKILYEDIPTVFNIRQSTIPILKKLIYLVLTSSPFSPNIERISSALEVSKEYVYFYIEHLQSAGIFNLIFSEGTGFKPIRKPSKIYLENPNLIFNLTENINFTNAAGAIRECFFVNQLKKDHQITFPKKGDFVVDGSYTFELGGRHKNYFQIREVRNSYLAVDNITIGFKNKIPLYLFGFLY